MKHVSVVLAALLLGVGVLVGILGLGAQSASAAPEGGFERVQTTALVEGELDGSVAFSVEADRVVKQPPKNPGSAVSWTIEVAVDGIGEFEDEGPTAGLNINFTTGRATLNTNLEGCGVVDVTWEASGEEFRSDNFFANGEGGEVRVVESVKLTAVSGTVCGLTIATVEEDTTLIIVEAGYCRGFGEEEDCGDLTDEVPSAPEL